MSVTASEIPSPSDASRAGWRRPSASRRTCASRGGTPSATRSRTRRPAGSGRGCASSGSTDGAYGRPYASDPEAVAALREKGLLQEPAPLPGRFEEIDALADRFGRERGVVSWPEREVRRLMADDDWDFGPAIRARAEEVLARGDLPDYPEEMRETCARLMAEHGIDTGKYLGG